MLTYRIASTGADFRNALALVEKAYEKEGYLVDDTVGHPQIRSFINRCGSVTILATDPLGMLCGTISIVKDSERGLPMDSTYKVELRSLRSEPFVLAEICQFATNYKLVSDTVGKTTRMISATQVSFGLFAHAVHTALRGNITHLCFSVHVKHELFYKLLGATAIGESKLYSLANSVPSRAFYIDLEEIRGRTSTLSLSKKIFTFTPREDFFTQNLFCQDRVEIPPW
jgi:hypothetical protein